MKFTTTFSLAALFASLVASADVPQSEIDFFTALVGDYQDHKTDYIKYFATAKDIPAELLTIATKVLTYQDDSYTTLLENDSLDVKAIESYVTELPWYTRLQEAVAGGASGSASAEASESESASASSSASKSASSSASKSASASSSASKSASASSSASKSESSSASASESATSSETSAAQANGALAPVGAALGALALALF